MDNPSQDYPGFPVRCSGHVCVCGFLYGKPHEAQCLQQATQEIRVRPGLFSAVPTGLIAICPVVDLFLTTAIRISRSEKLIWTRRCWIWLPSLESKYRAPLDLLFQPTAKRPIRHRVGDAVARASRRPVRRLAFTIGVEFLIVVLARKRRDFAAGTVIA